MHPSADRLGTYSVLTVCEAGLRRSPALAAYLEHHAPAYGLQLSARSAAGKAWAAPPGERSVSESMTAALQARSVSEITSQRQRKLTSELISSADLVLTINDELLRIARGFGAPPDRSNTVRGYLGLPPAGINDAALFTDMSLRERLRALAPLCDELEGYAHGVLRKLST